MKTRVGFAGGSTANPTYRNIGDHTETIDIEFDSRVTNFETILKNFWAWHDPTSSHSRQYMSVIFYHDDEQKKLAEKSKAEQQEHMARPIATLIDKAGPFFEAEDYHQKYILRRHSKVVDSLNLSDEELIKSYTACRLNGYLAGYGTEESFNQEKDELDISDSMCGYILQQIRKGRKF